MSSQFGFSIQLSALHTYIDRTASFYLILIKTPAGNLLAVETFPGSATTADITGLRPSTMYRIGVYGIDETGQAYKTSESLASTTDGKLCILHCFLFLATWNGDEGFWTGFSGSIITIMKIRNDVINTPRAWDKDKIWFPTVIERPSEHPVRCSNHWATKDSWRAGPCTRFM